MRRATIAIVIVVALAVSALAAFPVGLLRGIVERRLSAAYGAPVHVGALSRDSVFSFTPTIALRDVTIAQPTWAGPGDFVRLASASARISVLALITGQVDLRAVRVSGLEIALVRRSDGSSNWEGRTKSRDGMGWHPHLASLVIENSRFSLRDAKRRLAISGTIAADDRIGLALRASGTFDSAPAQISATGGRILADADSAWPFSAQIASAKLTAQAHGTMAGPLNTRDMTLAVQARAPSLKELDYLIEAGLFGTQPIDLRAAARHQGHDWFLSHLAGTIGRSRLAGSASVRKQDGRTRIDATLNASEFDFDDLADAQGLADAAALKARVGPRIVPATRIDLSHMGPTDGVIRFSAERLLFKHPSTLRSARGILTLDHRVARLDGLVVTMQSGRITGSARIDSRGAVPVLSTYLRIDEISLDTMIDDPATISGKARGIVRMSGRGETVRAAFAHGDGRIAFVTTGGSVKKSVAFVLGQDLGGAIGTAIGHVFGKEITRVPLRCAILAFAARDGVLTPDPLAIDTGVSTGRGAGRIVLDGETIALTLAGSSKSRAMLKLTDPIRINGTLSKPAIAVAGGQAGDGKPDMLKVLGRSIGSALGLRKTPPPPIAPPPSALACPALTARALR